MALLEPSLRKRKQAIAIFKQLPDSLQKAIESSLGKLFERASREEQIQAIQVYLDQIYLEH